MSEGGRYRFWSRVLSESDITEYEFEPKEKLVVVGETTDKIPGTLENEDENPWDQTLSW